MQHNIIKNILIDTGIILSYVLLSTTISSPYNQNTYYNISVFYHILVITIFTIFYIHSTDFKKYFFPSKSLSIKTTGLAIIIALLLILLSTGLVYFFRSQQQVLLPNNPITSVLLLIIVAIKEELFFRNYLLRLGQRIKLPLIISITSSSVAFALGHLYQGFIVGVFSFIVGMVFCFLFLRFKSIYICILSHGLYNTTLYLLYYSSISNIQNSL